MQVLQIAHHGEPRWMETGDMQRFCHPQDHQAPFQNKYTNRLSFFSPPEIAPITKYATV